MSGWSNCHVPSLRERWEGTQRGEESLMHLSDLESRGVLEVGKKEGRDSGARDACRGEKGGLSGAGAR